MPKKEKTFDTVAWVREHRDENYRRYGHLPLEEFARKLAERGQQSELWKRIKKQQDVSAGSLISDRPKER